MRTLSVSIATGVLALLFAACSDEDAVTPLAQVPASSNDPASPSDSPGAEPENPSVGDGGDAGARPKDAGPPVDAASAQASIADYDKSLAQAVCAKLAACCSQANYDTYFQAFTQKPFDLTAAPAPADCAPVLATQLGKLHQKWAASVTLKRMTFDAARAAKCVSDVNASTCGVAFMKSLYDPACFGARGNEVFTKIAAPGSSCVDIGDGTYSGECDPKLGYCGSDQVCKAWQTTGQPCSVTPTRQFCAPSLDCSNLTPTKPGTCSGPPIIKPIGGSCLDSTGPLVDCAAGSYCDWDTGVCTAKKADGASCKYDDDCASSYPHSCEPFGNGTCGSTSFCGGNVVKVDGGGK